MKIILALNFQGNSWFQLCWRNYMDEALYFTLEGVMLW